ncbi:Hypothetical protein, putative, partial [Bodo saltans]
MCKRLHHSCSKRSVQLCCHLLRKYCPACQQACRYGIMVKWWLLLIPLQLLFPFDAQRFFVAAQTSITAAGTFNVSCADVSIAVIGSVEIIDPGSSVELVVPINGLYKRNVTLSGSQRCSNLPMTVTTDNYYDSYGLQNNDQLQINFGDSNRSVIMAMYQFLTYPTSVATITMGGGNLSFSASTFYPTGTIVVVFMTNGNNIGTSTASNSSQSLLFLGDVMSGVLNVSTTGGGTVQARFGSLLSITCLLAGISSVTFSSGALLSSAALSLQGVSSSSTTAPLGPATALNVFTASTTFTMISTTFTINRAIYDPGNVSIFPLLSALTLQSSSIILACTDTSNNRVVMLGGNVSSSSSATSSASSTSITGTTFSLLVPHVTMIGTASAITLNSPQFSLVVTGTFGASGTVRIAPAAAISSTPCSSISVVSTNVLLDGPFSSTQFTVSGNQVNVTLSSSVSLSSVSITVTQLGSNAITCIPSNFNLETGATLYSSTFVMKPYALGVGLIQSGVVLVGSSIISIAPTSAVSTPARVTINTVYASTGAPTITFLPQGTSDVMYINPDRNETAFPPSLVPLGIVMQSVSCAGQQLVLGTDNSSSSSALLPARLQMISITASNIGAGISVASGSTFLGIALTSSSSIGTAQCSSAQQQPQLFNITFLGSTTLTLNTSAPVNVIGCTFLGPQTSLIGKNIFVANATGSSSSLFPRLAPLPALNITGKCGSSDSVTLGGNVSWLAVAVAAVPTFSASSGRIFDITLVHTASCSGVQTTVTVAPLVSFADSTLFIVNSATTSYSITNVVRSSILLTVKCILVAGGCGASTVQTTMAALALMENSVFTYIDTLGAYAPLTILNASAVGNSNIRISSYATSNNFGGFGLISNSQVTVVNTNSDLDIQTMVSGSNLQVQGNSSVVLQGYSGASACSSCDFSFRPSAWLSGTSLQLDAPRLNLAIASGTLQNFTLSVTRMRVPSFSTTTTITLINCSIHLSSISSGYDYLFILPALLVMNATTFTWTALYIEAILPWVSATTAQVKMYSGTQITLSAVSCATTSSFAITITSVNQLPMPGTTLDVQFPSSGCTTIVTVAGLAAAGSTLRLRSATSASVNGTFTSNTTFFVSCTSNAIVSFQSLVVSNTSKVAIDLSSSGVGAPTFFQQPFSPSAVTGSSRLEITAPNADPSAVWNINASTVTKNSSMYLNIPYVSVTVAAMNASGCSFTIIAYTITSVGAALGNNAQVSLQVLSGSTIPPAINLASVVSIGGYINVTLVATVAAISLVDTLIAGLHLFNSNISVIGPQCGSGCNTLVVDGDLLIASSISIRVLGRTVNVKNFDISTRNNSVAITALAVSIVGSQVVDASLHLAVDTAPNAISFEPRTLLRSNIGMTVRVAVTTTSSGTYQYSTQDNTYFTLFLKSVALLQRSGVALVSQYQLSSGAILSPSQIPAADVLPTVLTVTGRNWESGASLSLTDYRSNVTLASSLGNSTQRNVTVAVSCNAVTTLS